MGALSSRVRAALDATELLLAEKQIQTTVKEHRASTLSSLRSAQDEADQRTQALCDDRALLTGFGLGYEDNVILGAAATCLLTSMKSVMDFLPVPLAVLDSRCTIVLLFMVAVMRQYHAVVCQVNELRHSCQDERACIPTVSCVRVSGACQVCLRFSPAMFSSIPVAVPVRIEFDAPVDPTASRSVAARKRLRVSCAADNQRAASALLC